MMIPSPILPKPDVFINPVSPRSFPFFLFSPLLVYPFLFFSGFPPRLFFRFDVRPLLLHEFARLPHPFFFSTPVVLAVLI